METSIFVTDLAQQFFLSGVGPSHPVAAPRRVARAGTHGFFLILGLSFPTSYRHEAPRLKDWTDLLRWPSGLTSLSFKAC